MKTYREIVGKKEESELIKELINQFKKELISAKVQEFIYEQEYYKPTNISKAKAEEGMGIYQKRIKYLIENIEAVEYYAKHYDL